MLIGLHPALHGELLARLDSAGHGDRVAIVDANFPAARLGSCVIEARGYSGPEMVEAITSVIPADDDFPALLLDATEVQPELLEVQRELVLAAGQDPNAAIRTERSAFYNHVGQAFLVIRTGENRPYGNIVIAKGVIA